MSMATGPALARAANAERELAVVRAKLEQLRRGVEELRDYAALDGNLDDGIWYERLEKLLEEAA